MDEYDDEFLTQGRAALAAAAQWFEVEVTPEEWFFASIFWLTEAEMAEARGYRDNARDCIVKAGTCLARGIGMVGYA